MDRQEKINRIAEAGQNICTNFFFSNAERMMRILEEKDCDELKISLQMKLEKKETDGINGVGKVEFGSPNITIDKSTKFKDKYDDVVLDFVNPDLPGMDEDEKPGKKKKEVKQVAGQVVESLLLTDGEPESDESQPEERLKVGMYVKTSYCAGQAVPYRIKAITRDCDCLDEDEDGKPVKVIPHVHLTCEMANVKRSKNNEYFLNYYDEKTLKSVSCGDFLTIEEYDKSHAEAVNSNEKKPRKKKGDTMKVERKLTAVSKRLDEDDCNGCCHCEKEECDHRLVNFGDAEICAARSACSQDCPRLIK